MLILKKKKKEKGGGKKRETNEADWWQTKSSLMGEMAGSTVNEHGLLNDIEGNRE